MIEEKSPNTGKSPLRLLREQAGYTRPKVKQLIGISERMQADWESGKSMPTAENLAILARLYKIPLKVIYTSVGIDVSGIPDDIPLPRKEEEVTNAR